MKKRPDFQRRTPRQARAQVTVDSILEAAAQVLQRAGSEGFNTNAVAERAGVSIGTLYQYFPDKDAILVAVARREMSQPEKPHNALLAALVRALEKLLGGDPIATTPRKRRVAVKPAVNRILFQVEDAVRSWIILPTPLRPIPIKRR